MRPARMAAQTDVVGKSALLDGSPLRTLKSKLKVGIDARLSSEVPSDQAGMQRTNPDSKLCKLLLDDVSSFDDATKLHACGALGYVRRQIDRDAPKQVIFQSGGESATNFSQGGAVNKKVFEMNNHAVLVFEDLLTCHDQQRPEEHLRGNYNRVYKMERDSLHVDLKSLLRWPTTDSPREYAIRLGTTTAYDKWLRADNERSNKKQKTDSLQCTSPGDRYREMLEVELAASLHMASIGVSPPLAAGCILDVRGIPRLCLVSSWGGESTFKTLLSHDVENTVINQIVDQYITSCTRVANEGYVNFDVKPANFVVSEDSDAVHVKMIDFGTEYFCLASDTSHEVRLFCMLFLLTMHVIQDVHKRIAEIEESNGITDETQRKMVEKSKRTVHRFVQKMSTTLIHCWLQLNGGDELYDRWLLGFKFDHIIYYAHISRHEKKLRKLLGYMTSSYFFNNARKDVNEVMQFSMSMSAFGGAFHAKVTAPQLAVPLLMRYIFYKFCGTGSPRSDSAVLLSNSDESYEYYARLHAMKGPLLQNNVDKQPPRILPMFAYQDLKNHTGEVWFKSFGF